MISQEMRWDLSQLVEVDDPDRIAGKIKESVSASGEFRSKHQGKIESYNAREVLDLIRELERLELEHEGYFMYASLMYSADMTNETAKQLHETSRNCGAEVGQNLAFVELELGRLLKSRPDLVQDPVLKDYRHFLERILRRVPHMLSEELERLIIVKDMNGIEAWNQLHGDWLATRTFEIEIDGKKQVLPYGKMVGLYESPNRDLRRRAHETVYSGLGKDHIIWSSALRAVCSDHLQVCKLRQWPSPMTQSLIDNDVDEEAIHALMKTIEKNVKVYRSYLELKAKAMGLKRLGNWDITAPLPDLPDKTYTWDEAREIILDAYSSFDEEAGNYIREMYDRRHIDAEVRNGKRSGAFCSTWFAGKSAYILQSFNGTMGDVFTQAHELGHALHAYLGSRAQTPVNYRIGSCIAETGSIFGELLLTEKLLSKASSAAERRGILAKVLDEFGEAAFQVSTRVWFETMLYEAISNGEHLDGETVSQLWLKARDKMYGDSVEWLPEMKWWWTMKLHFYLPNYRYYNYPYVYAQLFVYAMYRLYKEQGKAFVPVLKSLLAAGSSKSPRELAAVVGFDVTKESSWQKGIDQFAEFAKMFKKTLEDK
ncbi:MAG: M3 family oligoendopeptidase [Candidatus Thorarchaeota archaeon]